MLEILDCILSRRNSNDLTCSSSKSLNMILSNSPYIPLTSSSILLPFSVRQTFVTLESFSSRLVKTKPLFFNLFTIFVTVDGCTPSILHSSVPLCPSFFHNANRRGGCPLYKPTFSNSLCILCAVILEVCMYLWIIPCPSLCIIVLP